MEIKNYLIEFTKMVDELKVHPKVRLLSFHAFAPTPESEIAEVEKQLGIVLDEDLKVFYRQCNGLQLRWAHLDNPAWDRKELTGFAAGPFTYQDVLDDAGTIDGCVNILPIKEVFLTDWVKRFGKNETAPATIAIGTTSVAYETFSQATKIFNLYKSSGSDAIVAISAFPQFIVNGFSNHRKFSLSLRFSITTYLDMLLAGKGTISSPGLHMTKKNGLADEIVLGPFSGPRFDLARPFFNK